MKGLESEVQLLADVPTCALPHTLLLPWEIQLALSYIHY